jgi:predicted nucleic acid-binding protein
LRPLLASGQAAVTDWVLLELMCGIRANETPATLLHWFEPVPRLIFDDGWWPKAHTYAVRLRHRGVSPTAADTLMATVALEHNAPLVHCDRDFEAMRAALPLRTLDWTEHLADG